MVQEDLSPDQLQRYSRQMILSAFPDDGQETLRDSSVLVVGLGGLGCVVANILARAGVGHLSLVDPDSVDISNLHRQILYDEDDIGRPKVQVAAEKLRYANSDIGVQATVGRIEEYTLSKVGQLVIDCCDHHRARQAVAAYAQQQGADVLTGSAQGFSGQIAIMLAGRAPYFADIYPHEADTLASQCEMVGIMGSTVGIVGALMAQEAIKHLLGIGKSLHGRLLLWNGVDARLHDVAFTQNV